MQEPPRNQTAVQALLTTRCSGDATCYQVCRRPCVLMQKLVMYDFSVPTFEHGRMTSGADSKIYYVQLNSTDTVAGVLPTLLSPEKVRRYNSSIRSSSEPWNCETCRLQPIIPGLTATLHPSVEPRMGHCPKGEDCEYCHHPHETRPPKLDRRPGFD